VPQLEYSAFVLRQAFAAQQTSIAVLTQPFGASKMAIKRFPRAIGLALCINMQDKLCDLAPIRAFSICVKQPQIGDQMLVIVRRQRRRIRRLICYIGIKWALRHTLSFIKLAQSVRRFQ
jgi:hypothetical protein